MLNVHFIGRLGGDATKETTKNGNNYIAYSVCVNDKNKATWVNVQDYRNSDKLLQWLKKGSLVNVGGVANVTAYKNKQGDPASSINVMLEHFEFVNSGNNTTEGGTTTTGTQKPEQSSQIVDHTPESQKQPNGMGMGTFGKQTNETSATPDMSDDLPF